LGRAGRPAGIMRMQVDKRNLGYDLFRHAADGAGARRQGQSHQTKKKCPSRYQAFHDDLPEKVAVSHLVCPYGPIRSGTGLAETQSAIALTTSRSLPENP
jgi:hypothetical protein